MTLPVPLPLPLPMPLPPGADKLALLEWVDTQGRLLRSQPVHAWPLSLGRGWASDAVLDDAFVAEQHARIERDEQGVLTLRVLATVNGAALDGHHHGSGSSIALPRSGGLLQLGQTRLRLRLPGEALPPERLLPPAAASTPTAPARAWPRRVLPWLLPLLVLEWSRLAISLDPGTDTRVWLPELLNLPGLLLIWCGGWALLSKLFQHHFDFMGHLGIAGPRYLVMQLVALVLPQVGAALGWPVLWHLAGPIGLVLGALLVHAHLVHVLPEHRSAVFAAVLGTVVMGGGILLNNTYRSQDSWVQAPYMSTLPLANWSSGPGADDTATRLVQDMAELGPALAARAKKARQEDRDNGEPDDSADQAP